MRVVTLGRGLLLLCLFLVVTLCVADEKRYEVVGIGECGDCKENNFKTSEAFSGLHVTIDCKFKTGETKRIGDSKLDESGEFKISLPQQIILQDEKSLKEECYAQLHSAAVPCPAHNGLEATKIIFKSQTNGKYTFAPTETLKFSSALCTSKFLWPYTKYPPLPKAKSLSWKKNWPKLTFPPLKKWPLPPPMPVYKPKPLPPPTPLYKPKPLPPPTPIYKPKPPAVYKPKPPVYEPPKKPLPPPTPVYKPKPPVYKPKPPVYQPPKKPFPPPTPVYKPKPPVYKPKPPVYQTPKKPFPPPTPVYKPKPPVVTKPLPPPFPLYPIPPFFKKPCPPFSKIPPNYFKHPKLGYFPPLPPFFPHA